MNEQLVKGREDIFFGCEFDASAGTKKLPDDAVKYYVDTLASDPDALRGSFGLYRAFDATIAQNEQRKTRRLTMPVLAIGGAESCGEAVADTMKLVADDVQSRGHSRRRPLGRRAGSRGAAGGADRVPGPVPRRSGALAQRTHADAAPSRSPMTVFGRVHMPSLGGATGWLNSEPLGPAELRGHVVLVNFWTLTCINWLRTEPYVRAWSQAYRDDGLVVIGVHTPEFSFEHEIDRVRRATKERAIDYPVAVDNDYAIWNAFDNHYWPALYFVDARRHHPRPALRRRTLRGVGARHPAAARRRARASSPSKGVGVEAEADWDHLRTPETYLGYARSEHFASPGGAAFDERRAYELPERLRLNHWALAGEWTIGRENVVLDQAGGSIAYRFHARDAHLVLSRRDARADPVPRAPRRRGSGPVARRRRRRGRQRRAPATAACTSSCASTTRSASARCEITFLEPGAEAYVFTFG